MLEIKVCPAEEEDHAMKSQIFDNLYLELYNYHVRMGTPTGA